MKKKKEKKVSVQHKNQYIKNINKKFLLFCTISHYQELG